MKKLFLIALLLASHFTFAAADDSAVANRKWVREFIKEQLSSSLKPYTETSETPEAISKTFQSSVQSSDGHVFDVSLTLENARHLALIVTDSTVEGVTNGTVYAWDETLSAFENPAVFALPIINADSFAAGKVVTNLSGVVSVVTNMVTHYRAAGADGTIYHDIKYYGRDYLVSNAGLRGGKIGFTVSQVSLPAKTTSAARRNVLNLFAAYADTVNSGVSHYNGILQVGKVKIRRKGKDEWIEINQDFTFDSGVGTGTIGEFTVQAFEDWYANPKSGAINRYMSILAERTTKETSWGGENADESIDLGDQSLAFRWKDLYNSSAWKSAMEAAQTWLDKEFSRIITELYEELKNHTCPALKPGEDYWLQEWDCKCRHTYPDLYTGEEVQCRNSKTPMHDFRRYKLEGGALVLSDGNEGCFLCSRCFQHDEEKGAQHIEVPESADYCGCYCGKYYEKKEADADDGAVEGEESELPGGIYAGGGDVIDTIPEKDKADVEVECTDKDGNSATITVTMETVKYTTVTNRIEITPAVLGFGHVTRIVRGANGKLIKITSSANRLMDDESARKRMHKKPAHPMVCTCKCGREHFFKPSPCPEICRGCRMAHDCFRPVGDGVDAEIWSGLTNGENCNIDVRGYHVAMADGYWKDETYTVVDESGEEVEKTWSNKDGGENVVSKYGNWYYGTTTNGYAACGCACGRFFSDSSGKVGADEKDTHGNIVGPGDHGTFHIYGLRRAGDIQCPFTAHVYAGREDEMLPYCTCNNHDWEASAANVSSPSGFVGHFDGTTAMDGGESGSLACKRTCRWHWPYSHSLTADRPQLDISSHDGVNLHLTSITGALHAAYIDWANANGGIDCGCLCQAVNKETCLESYSDQNDGNRFNTVWGEISDSYHLCNLAEECVCECGERHIPVTPETWKKYKSGETAPFNFSLCSEREGVCQICGFYADSGNISGEDLMRAGPERHVFNRGCACDCALDGTDPIFRPNGYTKEVRGWSAAVDYDHYPNNTRTASEGYMRTGAEKYHKSLRDGCVCSCYFSTGIALLHEHDGGESCKSVCKAENSAGIICGHAPSYYKHNLAADSYTEAMGEHIRSENADYCGCDCGRQVTRTEGGRTVGWHEHSVSDCYCYGHYSATSPETHGDAVLVGHINLRSTGETVTNQYTCAKCFGNYEMWAYRFICDNDHEVFGKEFGGEHECIGPGWTECPSNCACCPHDDGINCDCPFCRGILTATDCTCAGVSGDTGTTLKFTQPLLTNQDAARALEMIDLSAITEVDGDDPVYEIGEYAFANTMDKPTADMFCDLSNLTTIKFNFVTNICSSAFYGAFAGCANLAAVEFARLESVRGSAFVSAFEGSKVQFLSFPRLRIIEASAFMGMTSLKEVRIPEVTHIEWGAFSWCSNLSKIVLPKCTYISDWAFSETALKQIYLPAMSTNDIRFTELHHSTFPKGCRIILKDGELIAPAN